MNFDNIILNILGTICFGVVLWTGFYFQPLFNNYQVEASLFLKQHISTLTDATIDINQSRRMKETYAYPFVFGFFDKNNPIEIELTDLPNIIQKHPTGIF